MIRRFAAASLTGAALAMFAATGQAAANPADATTYAMAKCFVAGDALQVQPIRFGYNCDETGVMQDMTWSTWNADGARGTGTDDAIECQPNCAQGIRLRNPIVVHAWNPQPATTPGCPADVQFYSDLTIAYPGDAPPWIDPGTTWDAGTDFVTVDGMPGVHYSGLTPRCS